MTIRIIPAVLLICTAFGQADDPPADPAMARVVEKYRADAQRIIDAALAGNDAWNKLEELCDGIGHRLSGSPQLERAIDWTIERMRRDGQDHVRREKVMVPCWVRGRESFFISAPLPINVPLLGLGGSVGTPDEGLSAQVIPVADEAALEAMGEAARGKIILFNNPMPDYDPAHGSGYGTAVRFRVHGARLAADHGARACLVRSVTARSLQTPHAGAMNYGESPRPIPAAAITTEHAEMISRLHARGVPVMGTLKMEARTLPDAESANVVGELRGTTWPEQVVVISGHLDSWDVGQGAHDDGGGCVIAMEAVNVLRKLGLVPRRTIRVVLWTNEENGLRGAKQYAADHASELSNHVAAIESDSGIFQPTGYSVQCADQERETQAAAQLRALLQLLEPLGATAVNTGYSGADVGAMKDAGVILLGHQVEGSTYFDYHHTPADTLDKVDPQELTRNVAALATLAYVLADMEGRLGSRAED